MVEFILMTGKDGLDALIIEIKSRLCKPPAAETVW
jgi:hypothetical protein